MIPDWETNRIYFSSRLERDYKDTYKSILKALKPFGIKPEPLRFTKDIWARDYMPIQISKDKFIEYRYDPDYLQGIKSVERAIKTYPDIVCDSIGIETIKTNIILDGGNVVKSSKDVILTDKIIRENQYHYKKNELIDKLCELFEVDKVVLIPWDDYCIYGHADGMLRFINDEMVLISGFYEKVDEYFKNKIIKALEKAKIGYDWLRCGSNNATKNIAYINFLQTKDIILVPKLNEKQQDEDALKEISKFYPDYASRGRIVSVDVTDIEREGGALNCISWTFK